MLMRFGAFLVLVGTFALLAGCGGGADTSSDDTSTSGPAATESGSSTAAPEGSSTTTSEEPVEGETDGTAPVDSGTPTAEDFLPPVSP